MFLDGFRRFDDITFIIDGSVVMDLDLHPLKHQLVTEVENSLQHTKQTLAKLEDALVDKESGSAACHRNEAQEVGKGLECGVGHILR